MAENLIVSDGTKDQKYTLLYNQIKVLTEGEDDIIANMANISSMIHQTFGFWWTGFYRVHRNELILGPFQGRLHAAASLTARAFAERHGRKPEPRLFLTWRNFPDI